MFAPVVIKLIFAAEKNFERINIKKTKTKDCIEVVQNLENIEAIVKGH
jgi:hypothetical protein